MAYREAELLAMVEKDALHPDLLFTKDYIEKDGVTSDTGKRYEEVVLSWLLAHGDSLVKTDENWSMYRTAVRRASEEGGRLIASILGQKDFARGVALDMSIHIKDSQAGEWGLFPLASMDRTGRVLTVYDVRQEGEAEMPLHRLLRVWSWKESVNRLTLASILERKSPFVLKAAVLVTGSSNERYGSSQRRSISMPLQRLSVLLGVSELYAFHGIHLAPVNPGLPLYGQYSKAELLSLIEKDGAHPESLYQKEYINRRGVTWDTEEPYCQVLGDWLLHHRDIWMTLPRGMYRRVEGARAEKILKSGFWEQVRKQKVLPPFGRVLPDDLVFLGSRFQQVGRPAMMVHDMSGEGKDAVSLVRVLETPESSDTLLGTVLRAFTHLVVLDEEKLLKDMKLPEGSHIESRILLERGEAQTDSFLRDLPCLSELMKAMGIGLVMVEKGYEALW